MSKCNCPDRSKGKYSKICPVHRPATKAGERVEAFHAGKTVFGVIRTVRAGAAKVILDGGTHELNGMLSGVYTSAEPLAADRPTKMDKWTVVGYKEQRGGEETPRFNCKIAFEGKEVVVADNAGHGGPNSYRPSVPGNLRFVEQLGRDAKAWCEEFGYKEPSEAVDVWFGWAVDKKPYGVTAEKYLGQEAKQAAESKQWQREREDEERAEREEFLAQAKAAGMTHLIEAPAEDNWEVKLPARFKFLRSCRHWVPCYLIDTQTGRGIEVRDSDRLGVMRAVAQLFSDQPK